MYGEIILQLFSQILGRFSEKSSTFRWIACVAGGIGRARGKVRGKVLEYERLTKIKFCQLHRLSVGMLEVTKRNSNVGSKFANSAHA